MTSHRFLSPAKVNLFLRILYKRVDGYHELASLFQTVDLFDVMHFSLGDHDSLTTTDPTLPTDQSNLISRAVDLFRARTKKQFFVDVHVEKNIPQQAGLGGGSSNAATTLWALNTLLDSPCSIQELKEMGGELGSDVPFFFSRGTAYCTGRGELIEEVPPLHKLSTITVIKPPFGISTKQTYDAFDSEMVPKRDPRESLSMWMNGTPVFYNDLEVSAFSLSPEMVTIREKIQSSGFEQVAMCGSGSSFLCFGQGDVSQLVQGYQIFAVNPVQCRECSWYDVG